MIAKAPPSATESETQVVGSLLIDPTKIGEVADLAKSDFTDQYHAATFSILRGMHRDKVPIDVVTVKGKLDEFGLFSERLTSALYLADLAEKTVTAAHLGYHAGLVGEASRKRRLLTIGSEVVESALNGRSSDDILADLGSDVFDLQRDQVSDGWVCAADVEPTEVDWLWEKRIPYGMISILEADPEAGKSQITMSIVARATTGQPMPPHDSEPGTYDPINVLLLNCEDATSCTIRPRLDANGADLKRISIRKGLMTFPQDVARLRDKIFQDDAKLVIIDPINSYLDPKVDTNNDSSTRHALAELAVLAEETGCAVLLIRHHNKTVGQKAMHRGMGSVAYTGVARSVLMAAQSPDNPNQRFLARVKGNLCAPPAVLSYEIEPVGKTSRIAWTGERPDLTADAILGTAKKTSKQVTDLESRLEADRTAVCRILLAGPDTKRGIREQCKIGGTRIKEAIETLLEDGYVEPCEITRNGAKREAFKLLEITGTGHRDTGTVPAGFD